MPLLYVLATGFVVWMAVTAVRRGQAGSWLWIILVFGPLGALIYFLSEVAGLSGHRFRFETRRVTADDERRAAADVRRLDNAASWIEYASTLVARRRYAPAEEAARKAIERAPGSLDAWYALGCAALGLRRPREAAAALEEVVRAQPSYRSGEAAYALAHAQLEAGDAAAARATLESLSERSSRPEVLYDLASLQAQAGERDAARRSLQRIVDEAQFVPSYARRQVRPWVGRAEKALRGLR